MLLWPWLGNLFGKQGMKIIEPRKVRNGNDEALTIVSPMYIGIRILLLAYRQYSHYISFEHLFDW